MKFLVKSLLLMLFFSSLSYAQAKKIEEIKLYLNEINQFQSAGYYIAKEKGFYENEGLHVKIEHKAGQKEVLNSLMKNKSSYAVLDSLAILYRLQDYPIVALGAVFQYSPNTLATLESSNITSFNQLKNKKIALSSRGNDFAVIAALKSAGLNENEYELLKPSWTRKKLATNEADAISIHLGYEPYFYKSYDIPLNILDPLASGVDFYGDMVITTETELSANPQRAQKFLNATLKGWKYAFENIDESIQLILKDYNPDISKDALAFEAEQLKSLLFTDRIPLGSINHKKVQNIATEYINIGEASNSRNLSGFIANISPTAYLRKSAFLNSLTPQEQLWIKNNPSISVGSPINLPPFYFINNGKPNGFTVDLVNKIAALLEIEPIYVADRWPIVLQKLFDNEIDILSSVDYTEERAKKILYSNRYLSSTISIAQGKNPSPINKLSDLNGKKIAAAKSLAIIDRLRSANIDFELVQTKSIQESMQLVSTGQVDIYIDDLAMMYYLQSKYGIAGLSFTKLPEEEQLGIKDGGQYQWRLVKPLQHS